MEAVEAAVGVVARMEADAASAGPVTVALVVEAGMVAEGLDLEAVEDSEMEAATQSSSRKLSFEVDRINTANTRMIGLFSVDIVIFCFTFKK